MPENFCTHSFVCDRHVGSLVLGGNHSYRVSKLRTFVGKTPLQTLSFHEVLLVIGRNNSCDRERVHV